MRISLLALLLGFVTVVASLTAPDQVTAIVSIEQKVNLLGLLLDRDELSSLSCVFTTNATTNFIAILPIGTTTSVAGLESALSKYNSTPRSYHELTTQYVEVTSPETAQGIVYFAASFFAQPEGVYTRYGSWVYDAVLTGVGWRIENITGLLSGNAGNASILTA